MKPVPRSFLGALLAVSFVVASAYHLLTVRRAHAAPEGGVVLRLGHMALQPGMPEALEEIAAAYMELHPEVRILQNPVPLRAWPAWLRTQLIGGTAPDLLMVWGGNEPLYTRHYAPLGDLLDQPNPYNAGTPLEGIRWRDTFIDGLAGMADLTPTSGEVVGVPTQINTLRLFYNRTLLVAVTGSETPPTTYAELQNLVVQVAAHNARTGLALVPVAGCAPYAQYFFESLTASQTQRLVEPLSPARKLVLTRHEILAARLRGEWSYTDPAPQSAFRLLRDGASLLSPGFLALQRDDALFNFLQGRSVAIATGSWDYPVLNADGAFPVTIGPIPVPGPEHPDFGEFALGPVAESANSAGAPFGALRDGPNVEIARDFLRFLSSHRMASLIVERSARVSALLEVQPPARAVELAPVLDGALPGFPIDLNWVGGRHTYGVVQRNLHRLVGPLGDLEGFTARIEAETPAALRLDAQRSLDGFSREIRELDALAILRATRPGEPSSDDEARERRQTETLHRRQYERATLQDALAQFETRSRSPRPTERGAP